MNVEYCVCRHELPVHAGAAALLVGAGVNLPTPPDVDRAPVPAGWPGVRSAQRLWFADARAATNRR